MKCPICGSDNLAHGTRDLAFTYKSHATQIPEITADFCAGCGEVIMTMEQAESYGKAVAIFIAEVNAQFVDASYISRIRTKLGLTKREAAEIFGGGKNGFALYETGKATPPVSLVKLLKLLEKHPELLNDVRTA